MAIQNARASASRKCLRTLRIGVRAGHGHETSGMPVKPKPFFDTNILVYCFDADSAAKQHKSQELVTAACLEH
jgi:hypothetical protein